MNFDQVAKNLFSGEHALSYWTVVYKKVPIVCGGLRLETSVMCARTGLQLKT